jgi:pimeloyl-ACP methyl ester carboxylesterase/putative sterol carrier protein
VPGGVPGTLRTLIKRYRPEVFELQRPTARIRLAGASAAPFDVVLEGGRATLERANGSRPDALLEADEETWQTIADDIRGGMTAFRRGRLTIRHDLHLGVGFLAATAEGGEGALRFRHVGTSHGQLSICEAGVGRPVLLIHGLGATKVSFLPTLAALAPHHRAIAVDLPGFGDSDKPILAPYDAPFFASAMTALLDALELDRADVIGNSMGGRVALELGMSSAKRVRRVVLLAPSLAWLRSRPWAPYLRLIAPQLGLIQPAPRPVVEGIIRRLVGGTDQRWAAAGVDEFLRSYLTPRGRAAFYAAARNIYLEEPHGPDGFWTRLRSLSPKALFVWGRQDPVVPIQFAEHVRAAVPTAQHLELPCGHVPQLERPKETHDAVLRFLG